MPDIDKIIDSIDDYLRLSNKMTTNPVEINEHLNKKGLLSDSSSRPGAPIRKLLRNGQIPHAYQVGGYSVSICASVFGVIVPLISV